MKLSQFKYFLPQELIALHPLEDRDEDRLMVVDRQKQTIVHRKFKDIVEYFEEGDVIVRNDTKVLPSVLLAQKESTDTYINVFLLRELDKESRLWDALVDPARKIRIGNKLFFDDGNLLAEVIDNTTSRGRTLRFLYAGSYEEFRTNFCRWGKCHCRNTSCGFVMLSHAILQTIRLSTRRMKERSRLRHPDCISPNGFLK